MDAGSISDIISTIGLTQTQEHEKSLRKAQELLRLSTTKCQNLGKDEYLRRYIVTDLALSDLGISFSRDVLIKTSGAKEPAYNKVCSRVRNCMEGYVGSGEGRLEQLAIKFSGASAERARVMLKLYEDACRSEVTQEKRQRLNYTAPVYLAAAFCVASVELKAERVSRTKVASEVRVDKQELERICAHMVVKCGLHTVEHIRKQFKINLPGRDNDRQGRDVSDASPVAPRLEVPGDSPPASPRSSDRSRRAGILPTSRLFTEGADGPLFRVGSSSSSLSFSSHQPVPVDSALRGFVKRLRTVESPEYDQWHQDMLHKACGEVNKDGVGFAGREGEVYRQSQEQEAMLLLLHKAFVKRLKR